MAKKKEENILEENMSLQDKMLKFRNLINKKAGSIVAYDLNEDNPTEVKKWISTGSYLLDRIICKGKVAGIPSNKIIEIAGCESSGKSYIALQIAANALKEDFLVVYFDSENAIDPSFAEKILSKNGFTLNDFLYVQATSIEFVLETMEEMLSQTDKPILFILDSLANCPTAHAIEGLFDPLASIAEKARILSIGFQKLTIPLANHDSTFLILNQLLQRNYPYLNIHLR
jgi:recombination protein RecA